MINMKIFFELLIITISNNAIETPFEPSSRERSFETGKRSYKNYPHYC